MFASPRLGAASTRWSTRSRARRAPRRCNRVRELRRRQRACRSASRSRCASPRPTTSRCRPPTAARPCYIAVHVFQGMPYEQYFQGVEAIMDDYGGRPHWGKLHFQTAETLAPRYPRVGRRSRRCAAGSTPTGRFANAYTDRVLDPHRLRPLSAPAGASTATIVAVPIRGNPDPRQRALVLLALALLAAVVIGLLALRPQRPETVKVGNLGSVPTTSAAGVHVLGLEVTNCHRAKPSRQLPVERPPPKPADRARPAPVP